MNVTLYMVVRQLKVFCVLGVVLTAMMSLACSAPQNFTNPEMWKDYKTSWDSLDRNLKLAGFKMTSHGQMRKGPYGPFGSYGPMEYYRYQKGDVKLAASTVRHSNLVDDNSLLAVAVEGKLGDDIKQAFLISYIARNIASTVSLGGPKDDWFKEKLPRDIAEFWDRQSKGGWHVWKKETNNCVILKKAAADHIVFEICGQGTWAPLIDPPPATPPDFFSADLWSDNPAICFHRNIRLAGFKVFMREIIYQNNAICDACLYEKGNVTLGVFMSDGYVRALKIRGMPNEDFKNALLVGFTAMNLGLFDNSDKRKQWIDFGLREEFENIWAQRTGADLWGRRVSILIGSDGKGRIKALLDSPDWVNQALQINVPLSFE